MTAWMSDPRNSAQDLHGAAPSSPATRASDARSGSYTAEIVAPRSVRSALAIPAPRRKPTIPKRTVAFMAVRPRMRTPSLDFANQACVFLCAAPRPARWVLPTSWRPPKRDRLVGC